MRVVLVVVLYVFDTLVSNNIVRPVLPTARNIGKLAILKSVWIDTPATSFFNKFVEIVVDTAVAKSDPIPKAKVSKNSALWESQPVLIEEFQHTSLPVLLRHAWWMLPLSHNFIGHV